MKKSAYQKLKEENLKLKQDLITLSTNPASVNAYDIRMKWQLVKDTEKAFWMGRNTTHLTASKFAGFVKSNDNILA